MTLQLDHLANKWIQHRRFAQYLGVCLLVVCGAATPAWSADTWIGEGEDKLWDTGENWASGTEPTSGNLFINGPEAAGSKAPIIEEGIDAVAGAIFADFGRPKIKMTGGSLTVTGRGIFWGDASESTATFEMSGGQVDLTGSPGILKMGWQSFNDPARSSKGIWEMTDGEVNVKGVDMPGDNQGGLAEIGLFGGTFSVGTANGGLNLYKGATVDITEGVLELQTDKTAQVEGYIENGWITAYDGDGELSVRFAGGVTTVTAISPFKPGDYNANGSLDAGDLDLQSQAIKDQDLAFDETGDGSVDIKDREFWTNDLKNTWMGDADLNGQFNSSDFVIVFGIGKYETGQMAGWAEGDWNGDMEFNTSDFVAAFSNGGYEMDEMPGGPNPATAAVPEPSSVIAMLTAMAMLGLRRRRT